MKQFAGMLFSLLLLLGACNNSTKPASDPNESFESFKAEFLTELWKQSPDWASWAGLHEYDSLLIPNTAEARAAYLSSLDSLETKLQKFDLSQLSDLNAIDYHLMQNYIESGRWYTSDFKAYEWNPSNTNVADRVWTIINGTYADLDTRLQILSAYLAKVPEEYKVGLSNITTPTIEHLELGILQNKGGLQLFNKDLEDSISKSTLSEDEKAILNARVEMAKASITDYISGLEGIKENLNPDSARSPRLGKTLYFKKYALEVNADYTAEEIYNKALQAKKSMLESMVANSDTLWDKYMNGTPKPEDKLLMVKQLIDKISEDHVKRDEYFETIKTLIPKLVAFVDEHQILTQDPTKPLVVRETPLYMRGSGAGASVSSPGPYDKDKETYYNVTPLDNYTDEEAESYLREYNHYILQILNIHEAIPGHYTQLVYANKVPSVIKSILGNGAMIEGWAVYTERMMLEEGYENSPEMWLMLDKWQLRAVTNTILDYSYHVLNLSKEEGMKLMIDEAFQQQTEANNKWRRLTLSSVQLTSYFTGYSQIYELRDDVKVKKGDAFNLKQFHEQFLSYGSAPVKYIRELIMSEN